MLILRMLCLSALFGWITPAFSQDFPELPPAVGAWHAVGQPERHAGTDLYSYMDGGAELYLEHGFQDLVVRFYERGNDQVSVELYRMKASGHGIFTLLRSDSGEPVLIGEAGCRSGYYVIFWGGRFYCAVTAQSEFPEAGQAAIEIANAVARKLPTAPAARSNTEPLPEKDRLLNSEKVIPGPISLRNVSDALAAIFTGFADGAAARYGQEKDLAGFLRWPTAARAAAAFKQARGRAAKEKDFRASFANGELSFYDFQGKSGLAVLTGNRAVFAIADEPVQARELISRLKQ